MKEKTAGFPSAPGVARVLLYSHGLSLSYLNFFETGKARFQKHYNTAEIKTSPTAVGDVFQIGTSSKVLW
jgi:hypothetical protein